MFKGSQSVGRYFKRSKMGPFGRDLCGETHVEICSSIPSTSSTTGQRVINDDRFPGGGS